MRIKQIGQKMQNECVNSQSWSEIDAAEPDPIYSIAQAFSLDTAPNRLNLSVGVYQDESGRLPLLECVSEARKLIFDNNNIHAYLAIDGASSFTKLIPKLLFGQYISKVGQERIATFQTPGGTGALSLAAEFLKKSNASSRVWISNPSWANHNNIFASKGFIVEKYPYYSQTENTLLFEALLETLKTCQSGDIVVLHGCCHNPTGCDLSIAQWKIISKLLGERGALPLVDIAYQGFGENLQEDVAPLRELLEHNDRVLIAHSLSKSMALYGERVGSLTVVAGSENELINVTGHLKKIIRSLWSSPPAFGGHIAAEILKSDLLYSTWVDELNSMRERIIQMRELLDKELSICGFKKDLSFIVKQSGMFSLCGLNLKQIQDLRSQHNIYMVENSRICIAALNTKNIRSFASAFTQIME